MMWSKRTGLLLLLPTVAWILVFTLFPLVQSLWFSFNRLKLGREPRFGGFSNYSRIFRDDRVFDVLLTSAFLSIGGLILTIVVGVGMAWLFNRDLPGIRHIRAALTMPLFTAPIAISFAGIALFNETNGPVNNLLRLFAPDQTVLWLSDPILARVTVLLIDSWQWTPFVFIVVLAAMQAIPDDLYEAAASRFQFRGEDLFQGDAAAHHPGDRHGGDSAVDRDVQDSRRAPQSHSRRTGGRDADLLLLHLRRGLKSFNLGYGAALSWMLVLVCALVTTAFFVLQRKRYEVT